MIALFTCKNKKAQFKNESTRLVTLSYIDIFRLTRVASSVVSMRSGLNSNSDFIVVPVVCKNEVYPSKNENITVVTTFLLL